MIAGINVISVSNEIMRVMGQTGRRQVDCSRVVVRQLQMSRRPAAANERSPTVTSRDRQTSKRLEVDERSQPRRLDSRSATYCSWSDKYWGAVPRRAQYTMTAGLNVMRLDTRSQWKMGRASAMYSKWWRPAIYRAAVLRTDWRWLSREARRPANVTLP